MYKTYYYYDTDNRVSQVYDGGVQETYTYDSYGRLTDRVSNISRTKNVLKDKINYQSGTARVLSLNSTSIGNYNVTHTYDYDNNGNIIEDNTTLFDTSYVYDTANQLIRENNEAAGKTWVWTYDDAGNITSRKEYAYTTGTIASNAVVQSTIDYSYSTSTWGDLLTSFKGKTVSSDAIGNIKSISGYRSYEWEHGRQLKQSTFNGSTWNYLYNADGMRYRRSNGNEVYTYYYNGDLLRYVDYDSNTTDSKAAAKLYFVLDASGKPIEVSYRPEGSTTTSYYYYIHNLQGDVEALVDSSDGNAVVWYTYDAWGNVLTVGGSLANTLGKLNPFRYRSYIYDPESKLYYLQSRYYDPEMGRFINADVFATTGQGLLGNNMFSYCNNNPVSILDTSGAYPVHFAEELHERDIRLFAEWYRLSDGDERDKSGRLTLNAKLKRTATSVLNNFELSVGVGQGLYAEFSVLEFGASIGMYGNYASLNYSDGQWIFGQELCETASLSASQGFEVGFGINRFSQNGKVVESSSWYVVNDTQESWTIFSVACYPLFLGGSFRIGFDVNTFLNDMDAIWERK